MMKTDDVVLVVMFGERARFYDFLRDLDRGAPVEKTLLRSRLTERGAWMRLALRGPAERVAEIVNGWRDAIVAYTRLAS